MAVTLDWLGCATFRLNIHDLVVFLDAYIDRVPSAAPTGIAVDDIKRADWIVVGHSHFDHVYGAERIAKATGATIIGSYETVRVMEAMGVPLNQLMPVAGGERVQLAKDVVVHVYPSQHSCVWTNPVMPASDQVCLGDLGVLYQEQQERFAELWNRLQSAGAEVLVHLTASNQGARGDGGALVYLFETAEGSLLFQDTSGHWSGIFHNLRPDVAILAAAGRGNIDGEPIQGTLAQFVARQADLLRPGEIILSHHDNWLPGFSQAVNVSPIRSELKRWVPKTTLVEMEYLASHPIFRD